MSLEYSRSLLRVVVAQICQQLGWHTIQQTPLEILTDLLERYLTTMSKSAHAYATHFGQTEPSLATLGFVFEDMNVSLAELEDYMHHVDPLPFANDVPAYPVPHENTLRFPKPNSRELLERGEHIDDHLPPMSQEWDDEIIQPTRVAEEVPMVTSPTSGEKRPLMSPTEGTPPPNKRQRILPEEAGHSKYEMKSILMTHAGVLTPTRGTEGKLPDALTPPPPTPTIAPVTQPSLLRLSPPHTPVTQRPSVISETVEERTMLGDQDIDPSKIKLKTEEDHNISHNLVPPLQPGPSPKTPKIKDKKPPSKSKKLLKSPRSPAPGGKTPSKSKGGSKALKAILTSKETDVSNLSRETLSPALTSEAKSEDERVEDGKTTGNESPKLIIAEDDARRLEALEARNQRLASYEETINAVVQRVMEDAIDEDSEDEDGLTEAQRRDARIMETINNVGRAVKESTAQSPRGENAIKSPGRSAQGRSPGASRAPKGLTIHQFLDNIEKEKVRDREEEDEESRQKRREMEVQAELEKIREKQRELERLERERLERESKIDDTIEDVIRQAFDSGEEDGDVEATYVVEEPVFEQVETEVITEEVVEEVITMDDTELATVPVEEVVQEVEIPTVKEEPPHSFVPITKPQDSPPASMHSPVDVPQFTPPPRTPPPPSGATPNQPSLQFMPFSTNIFSPSSKNEFDSEKNDSDRNVYDFDDDDSFEAPPIPIIPASPSPSPPPVEKKPSPEPAPMDLSVVTPKSKSKKSSSTKSGKKKKVPTATLR